MNIPKNYIIFNFLLFFIFNHNFLIAQENSIEEELFRLNVNKAIIIQSQAIDESLLWSSNSKSIAYNELGKWYKIELDKIELDTIKYQGEYIAVSKNKRISKLNKLKKTKYNTPSLLNYQKLVLADSSTIDISNDNFGSKIILRKNNPMEEQVLWKTKFSPCYNLALSPTQKYLIFICETIGVVLIKLN